MANRILTDYVTKSIISGILVVFSQTLTLASPRPSNVVPIRDMQGTGGALKLEVPVLGADVSPLPALDLPQLSGAAELPRDIGAVVPESPTVHLVTTPAASLAPTQLPTGHVSLTDSLKGLNKAIGEADVHGLRRSDDTHPAVQVFFDGQKNGAIQASPVEPLDLDSPEVEIAVERQRMALTKFQLSPRKIMVFAHSYDFPDDGTPGLHHYSMRSALSQMRMVAEDPNLTVIIFVESKIPKVSIDAYGITDDMKKRIHLISLDDSRKIPISEKLLLPEHQRHLDRARKVIEQQPENSAAILQPYMSHPRAFEIAERLGIPDSVLSHHPAYEYYNGKIGQRLAINEEIVARYAKHPPTGAVAAFLEKNKKRFSNVHIKIARGRAGIKTRQGVIDAINYLTSANAVEGRQLNQIVIKMPFGSSGEGMEFPRIPSNWIDLTPVEKRAVVEKMFDSFPLGPENEDGRRLSFYEWMRRDGVVVEEFIPEFNFAKAKLSFPSAQFMVFPGDPRLLLTADQILENARNFIGLYSYAPSLVRGIIEELGTVIADVAERLKLFGFGSADFISVIHPDNPSDPKSKKTLSVFIAEENFRVTAAYHGYQGIRSLTHAVQKYPGAPMVGSSGNEIHWKTLDHDIRPNLIGLSEKEYKDFMDKPENQGLKFDFQSQEGFLPYMMPAWSDVGNVAYAIAARSRKGIDKKQKSLTAALNRLEVSHVLGIDTTKTDKYLSVTVDHDVRRSLYGQLPQSQMRKVFDRLIAEHIVQLSPNDHRRSHIVFHGNDAGFTIVVERSGDVADDRRQIEMGRTVVRSILNEFRALVLAKKE